MKAFVTGGSGFVGSHLIDALVRRGDTVTALVRSSSKAEPLERLGVRTLLGSLDQPEVLARAVPACDVVYHVAGRTSAPDRDAFFRANDRGTRNVLEAAGASRPRFVHVSSLAAAGPAEPGRPLRGDEPPRPVTDYGRSKLAGEQAVSASGLPWTVVRPPVVFGPRDREVLKLFRICRFGIAPVFGDGRQELSLVYAPDLAEALVAVGNSAAAVGKTYYACSEERLTSAQFVQAVGVALGKRIRLIHVPERAGRGALRLAGALARFMGRSMLLDGDKANELYQAAWTADPRALTRDTGWSAAHPHGAALARTVGWYREEGWM